MARAATPLCPADWNDRDIRGVGGGAPERKRVRESERTAEEARASGIMAIACTEYTVREIAPI